MVCHVCGHQTRVTNSRLQRRSNTVWRRRHCPACGLTFTTEEVTDYTKSWVVRGNRGKLEPFERDRLLLSLHKSLGHRRTAIRDASGLTDTVIGRLGRQLEAGSIINRGSLVSLVVVTLNRFDKLAASHYSALHGPNR